jgi:hypothetical protein
MNETLRKTLKQLRLSGLLESLEIRLQEAIGHGLSHSEFLELILQTSWLCVPIANSSGDSNWPSFESENRWRILIGRSIHRSRASKYTTWRVAGFFGMVGTYSGSARRAWERGITESCGW